MRIHRLATVLIASGVAACMAPVAVRASDALAECARVQDDTARLACYDRLAGRTAAAGAATAAGAPSIAVPAAAASTVPAATAAVAAQPSTAIPAAAPAAAAPSTVADPVADFGLSARIIQERDPGNWVDSITGTVKNVSQNASGRYVVELDSGQVWAQAETNAYPVLKAGDTVTIKRGAVGSFVLSGPRSVSWRVRRVR